MKKIIILLIIFISLLLLGSYLSNKHILEMFTLEDGYIGAFNSVNGNTRNKWIKIATIDMTKNDSYKNLIANIYPKLNNSGEPQSILKISLCNINTLVKPIIHLQTIEGFLQKEKVVNNVAVNNSNNLITVWIQLANNWLDTVRVRYGMNSFEKTDQVALTAQPMVSSLPRTGTYYKNIVNTINNSSSHSVPYYLPTSTNTSNQFPQKISTTKQIGNELIVASRDSKLALQKMIIDTKVIHKNAVKKDKLSPQKKNSIKKMKDEIEIKIVNNTSIKPKNQVPLVTNAVGESTFGSLLHPVIIPINTQPYTGVEKPLTLHVDPISVNIKIIDDCKNNLKALKSAKYAVNPNKPKLKKALDKANKSQDKAVRAVIKAEKKIQKDSNGMEKTIRKAQKYTKKASKDAKKVATLQIKNTPP